MKQTKILLKKKRLKQSKLIMMQTNTATHRSDFCDLMGVCGRPGDPSQRGYRILTAEIGSLVWGICKQFCREAH